MILGKKRLNRLPNLRWQTNSGDICSGVFEQRIHSMEIFTIVNLCVMSCQNAWCPKGFFSRLVLFERNLQTLTSFHVGGIGTFDVQDPGDLQSLIGIYPEQCPRNHSEKKIYIKEPSALC
jgi:hypothetical protein